MMNLLEHSNTGGVNKYTQTISPAATWLFKKGRKVGHHRTRNVIAGAVEVTQGLAMIPNFAPFLAEATPAITDHICIGILLAVKISHLEELLTST